MTYQIRRRRALSYSFGLRILNNQLYTTYIMFYHLAFLALRTFSAFQRSAFPTWRERVNVAEESSRSNMYAENKKIIQRNLSFALITDVDIFYTSR